MPDWIFREDNAQAFVPPGKKRAAPSCARRLLAPLGGQRGMALVLTLVMLTLVTILGALALSTSTTEIGISGNYRASQEAFYAVERAVEYAMTSEYIFSHIGTGSVTLTDGTDAGTTEDDHATNIAAGTSGAGQSGLKSGANNQVEYIGSGPLPPGSGSDPTYFQSRFYVINVTCQGPSSSEASVEAQVARIVPK